MIQALAMRPVVRMIAAIRAQVAIERVKLDVPPRKQRSLR
jgi:hypothetical protein